MLKMFLSTLFLWACGLPIFMVAQPLLLSVSFKAASAEPLISQGKCLDSPGSSASDHTPLQIYTCHGRSNQDWHLQASGQIQGIGGKCIDVPYSNPTDGNVVQLFTCHPGQNQQWHVTSSGEIRGIGDKCLDIRGGAPVDGAAVQIYTCHGGPNQRWAFGLPQPVTAGVVIERTSDWCRTGEVIHVFKHHFDIDGSTQKPTGQTGPSIVVKKGTIGTTLDLEEDRWRWLCGEAANVDAGMDAAMVANGVSAQCKQAFEGDSTVAALCQAGAYVLGPILQGILGNWESTRCAGAKRVVFDYKSNGRIDWVCYNS
jgi:hypothetical protein